MKRNPQKEPSSKSQLDPESTTDLDSSQPRPATQDDFANSFTWSVIKNLVSIAGEEDPKKFFGEDCKTLEDLQYAIEEYVREWLIPDPMLFPLDNTHLVMDLIDDALEEIDWEEVAIALGSSPGS